MFNWFRRLFKIGEAEAHAALDKLENPINMIEQGIRDLREDLNKGLKSLAEIKALAIKAENEQKEKLKIAGEYEHKALLLLQKAQAGNLEATEADRLAAEALMKKHTTEQHVQSLQLSTRQYNEMASKIDSNNKMLKSKIEGYESELGSLKARVKVARSTKDFNQKLAGLDANNTLRMLEKMKDKIRQEEALAESYASIADNNKSIDEQINKALEGSMVHPAVTDSLAQLKAKLAEAKRLENQ
ncbi:MAG: PspA/IM30 family protein [Cytophagaceae bacterium]